MERIFRFCGIKRSIIDEHSQGGRAEEPSTSHAHSDTQSDDKENSADPPVDEKSTSENDEKASSACNCNHSSGLGNCCNVSPNEDDTSSDDCEQQFKNLCDQLKEELLAKKPIQIHDHINEIFERRLREIDDEANGDIDLKLATYAEWANVLRKINDQLNEKSIELEQATEKGLELLVKGANAYDKEIEKKSHRYQQDIRKLVALVKDTFDNPRSKGKGERRRRRSK